MADAFDPIEDTDEEEVGVPALEEEEEDDLGPLGADADDEEEDEEDALLKDRFSTDDPEETGFDL